MSYFNIVLGPIPESLVRQFSHFVLDLTRQPLSELDSFWLKLLPLVLPNHQILKFFVKQWLYNKLHCVIRSCQHFNIPLYELILRNLLDVIRKHSDEKRDWNVKTTDE